MPLVNVNGPKWSRPLVRDAERRLEGVNPILRFLASLFRRRSGAGVAPAPRSPALDPAGEPRTLN
jgi:hypothetical protein